MLEASLSDVGQDVLNDAAEAMLGMTDEESQIYLREHIMRNPFKPIAEAATKTVNAYEEHRNDPDTVRQVEELMQMLKDGKFDNIDDIQLLITDETNGEDDGNDDEGNTKH